MIFVIEDYKEKKFNYELFRLKLALMFEDEKIINPTTLRKKVSSSISIAPKYDWPDYMVENESASLNVFFKCSLG